MGFGKQNVLIAVIVGMRWVWKRREAGDNGAGNEAAINILGAHSAIKGKRNLWDGKCNRDPIHICLIKKPFILSWLQEIDVC